MAGFTLIAPFCERCSKHSTIFDLEDAKVSFSSGNNCGLIANMLHNTFFVCRAPCCM